MRHGGKYDRKEQFLEKLADQLSDEEGSALERYVEYPA